MTIANSSTSRWLLLGLLLIVSSHANAWYNNSWHYRVPIGVPAGAAVNSTVKVDVDFASLLTILGVTGTFDINSPRVVRNDDSTPVTVQEFTDSVYSGATDASNNSRGEIRFILQDSGAPTYYLYFDVVANGPKAANSQTRVNGNFEYGASGTATPNGWLASSRSNANMDLQMRPAETVTVNVSGDNSTGSTPTSVATNGNPNTGNSSYLIGFRSNSDQAAAAGTNATLTRDITLPASNPGSLSVRIKPEGWDAARNGDTNYYDFLQVRLLNPSTSAVLLNVVGPTLNNYATCPFSPNYRAVADIKSDTGATNTAPGYKPYNYWDMGLTSNSHTLSMANTFSKGSQPWITCSNSLSSLAGQTVRLQIKMSVTNLYRSWFLIDDVEWSVVSATVGVPQALVVVVAPSGFNAFETATTANSVSGVLKTKIAGTAFGFDVVALTTTPSVLTSFTGAVKVELVDGSNTAAACASMTSIQTVASSYTFTATDAGRHTFSGISQAQAYRDVLVRISYPASAPNTAYCSTDHFAIRPASFTAAATDTNWTTAGSARILNGTTATSSITHKAGQPFTLTVTAYNSLGGITTGYIGDPTANSQCVLPASGCTLGIFNTGPFTANNGVLSSATADYSEVGVVSIIMTDVEFASIDEHDGSTDTERTITSAALAVGRFVPDHFELTLNTPSFAPSCSTFTYLGQPIKYAINPVATVTAKNASHNTAHNYSGSLWKIVPTDATYGISPSYSEAGHTLTVLNSAAPSVTDSGNGSGTLTFADTTSNILAVNRNNPLAPFDAELALSFNLQDTDSVDVDSVDGVPSVNPVLFGAASLGNGIAFSSGYKTQRWGRLVLQNAFGSELNNLSVPLFSEYFNGVAFVPNSADSCTTLSLSSQLRLSNPETASGVAQAGNAAMTILPSGTTHATLASATLSAGDAGLSFSSPGAGNTGYIDITGNFSSLSWLLFDWDNNGSHDNSPSARATFGVYKGNSNQIYLREVY